MNKRLLIHLCLLIPLFFTVLNLQVLISIFINDTIAQVIAYMNLGLILAGIGLIINIKGELSKTARLWIIFYTLYFVIAIAAGVFHRNSSSVVASMIPLFYTVGFFYYLSILENTKIFVRVLMISLFISCVLCIYFDSINFDLDRGGVHIYTVDRAQGVYGDANNMALVCNLTFLFFYKFFNLKNKFFKVLRLAVLATIALSLFKTFSTTGLSVFILCVVMLNYKFFTGIRLILGLILIPIFYVFLLNLNTITADMNLVGQQRDKVNNLVNVLSFNFDKVDDSGRGDLAAETLHYIYKNPFFGNGVDFGALHEVHNTYLGIWADAGIFVFMFFIIMLIMNFLRGFTCIEEYKYFIWAVLISMSVFMLSLHSVINQPYLMAIFIYIAYQIDNRKPKIE
ncbi:MAG: hypothetical protein Wins2KO_03470 [Winogradskyella sp.]